MMRSSQLLIIELATNILIAHPSDKRVVSVLSAYVVARLSRLCFFCRWVLQWCLTGVTQCLYDPRGRRCIGPTGLAGSGGSVRGSGGGGPRGSLGGCSGDGLRGPGVCAVSVGASGGPNGSGGSGSGGSGGSGAFKLLGRLRFLRRLFLLGDHAGSSSRCLIGLFFALFVLKKLFSHQDGRHKEGDDEGVADGLVGPRVRLRERGEVAEGVDEREERARRLDDLRGFQTLLSQPNFRTL